MADLGTDRQLARLKIRIRAENIEVPEECRKGLESPYLNGLSVAYGRWNSGKSYFPEQNPEPNLNSAGILPEYQWYGLR